MRRAAAVGCALAGAVSAVASPALAGTWSATNSLEMKYTGEVSSDVAEARVGNAGGGPAFLYEWPRPGAGCGEPMPEGRCLIRGGHWLASRFVAELNAGDDVFSVYGPAPDPASRINGVRLEGGPDRDMIYSRLDRSETQLSGQYGIVNGDSGDDMLDLRDAEGSSVDCGSGVDTAYLDPAGTTEHGTPETWQNCEHVVYGPDTLAAVTVRLALPANGLTGDQAPRVETLEAVPEPGAALGPGRFECRLADQYWRACAVGDRVAAPGEGSKGLLVRWIGADGVIGDALGLVTWRVDTVPPVKPVVTRRSLTAGGHVREEITFGVPEPVTGFECSVDGGPYAPCASPLVLVDPAPGARSVDVRSVDEASNRSDAVGVRWSVAAPRAAGAARVVPPAVARAPKLALRAVRAARVTRGVRLSAACRYDGEPIRCTVRWKAGARVVARDRTGANGKALVTVRQWPRRLALEATAEGGLKASARLRLPASR